MVKNIYLTKKTGYLLLILVFLSGGLFFLSVKNNDHLSGADSNPGHKDIQVTQSPEDPDSLFSLPSNPTVFSYPDGLRPQVEFWKKIFAEYTSSQVIIHDRRHVSIVYSVIDMMERKRYSQKARRKTIRTALNKYRRILRKLKGLKTANMSALSGEEKSIFRMIKAIPGNYSFDRASRNLRTQDGMKESFQQAMVNASRYLKTMEQIFTQYGLPAELARLPFLESSFDVRAYSSAGAAGIWQLTRFTGKHYLKIDRYVDERRDPVKSTDAAARLLSSYYRQLESWPLAITAYNHGAYGLKNAVRKTKSRDIETIINKYRSRSFGFSSRNFYAEFLAILEVSGNYRHYFGEIGFTPPDVYDEFILKDYVKMKTLLKYCSLDRKVITRLNPELNKSVLKSRRFLPKQYRLKVPAGMKEKLTHEYTFIAATEKRNTIDITKLHHVKSGQNLSSIAKLYNASVKAIIKANSIKDPNRLLKGQVLKIPTKA
jgi:membrane-bound lytic murein transglycosylase D